MPCHWPDLHQCPDSCSNQDCKRSEVQVSPPYDPVIDYPMVHRSLILNEISVRLYGQPERLRTRLRPPMDSRQRFCRAYWSIAPATGIYSLPHTSVDIGAPPLHPIHLSGLVSCSLGRRTMSTGHSHISNGPSQHLSMLGYTSILHQTSRCLGASLPISREQDP